MLLLLLLLCTDIETPIGAGVEKDERPEALGARAIDTRRTTKTGWAEGAATVAAAAAAVGVVVVVAVGVVVWPVGVDEPA